MTDETKEAVLLFADGLEALCVQLRRTLNSTQTKQKPQTNSNEINSLKLELGGFGDQLTITDKDTYIEVKTKYFLGSDNFSQIHHIIQDKKGEYISAGKDSHWRINK